jgi:hypothetical protein
MKAYGGVDVQIHIFSTSALAGGEWSASCPSRFSPGETRPGTHWIGGWVHPGASLDNVQKRKLLPPPILDLRPLSRLARSQSLYRLRYCSSSYINSKRKKNVTCQSLKAETYDDYWLCFPCSLPFPLKYNRLKIHFSQKNGWPWR